MSSREHTTNGSDALLLKTLLRNELMNVPLTHWGYFYPCHIAVWRFIEQKRPGILGELSTGYDAEPYFRGKGSEWFCGTLGNTGEYLDLLEAIMYDLVDGLSPSTKERGYLLDGECPELDLDIVRTLASAVLAEADKAEKNLSAE